MLLQGIETAVADGEELYCRFTLLVRTQIRWLHCACPEDMSILQLKMHATRQSHGSS